MENLFDKILGSVILLGGIYAIGTLSYMGYNSSKKKELEKKFHEIPKMASIDSVYKFQRDSLAKAYHIKIDSLRKVYENRLENIVEE